MKKSLSLKDKKDLNDIVKGLLLYGSPLPCKRVRDIMHYIPTLQNQDLIRIKIITVH